MSTNAEMYICSFLRANTNTNTFEKNKKIQIREKILPKNVFEKVKPNTVVDQKTKQKFDTNLTSCLFILSIHNLFNFKLFLK